MLLEKKVFLPISLDMTGQTVLIVGGGSIAHHKAKSLLQFSIQLIVVAPKINKQLQEAGVICRKKRYNPSDLAGISLVYAATDSAEVNEEVRTDATKAGVLVNVADNRDKCAFISPAIIKKGYMTVAVSSNGENVKQTVQWRDLILDKLQKLISTTE